MITCKIERHETRNEGNRVDMMKSTNHLQLKVKIRQANQDFDDYGDYDDELG